MPDLQTVAGYYRVSLARDNMHAPELYEHEITRYCAFRKLTLGRIYRDIDHSAFRGAQPRPALDQLVSERHNYTAIVVPKLSRFGRSMKELVRLFDVFDTDRIPLVFLDMNLDTSTSQGRLLRHILAAFAEYESDVKADYTRATHRRIRAEGRPWGQAPFGYERGPEPNTWLIDKDRALIVRQIFDDYRAGSSANAIAKALNQAGIKTPRGLKWKGQAISKILDNPVYAGLSLVDDDFVTAQWEPLVRHATWDAVRKRRAADPRRRGNLGKARPPSPYLLSGLMWCGQCGVKMTHTVTTRDHKGVYHCGGKSWETWDACLNARVYGPLVEDFISERFLQRCAFTILTESEARAGSPRTLWADASLPEKKRLLGLVIERIVATPLDINIPVRQYRTKLRHDLHIEWKGDMASSDEIVVLADVAQSPQRRDRGVGRHGKFRANEYRELNRDRTEGEDAAAASVSWAEWRRRRLLPP